MSASEQPLRVVLVVDVANVMGSRPDGWWRDRAAAATRLLLRLETISGAEVDGPPGVEKVRIVHVRAVLEGAARMADGPGTVTVVRAPRDGDSEIVTQTEWLAGQGLRPLVVTADRGLRAQLPEAALVAGPEWLNSLLGR